MAIFETCFVDELRQESTINCLGHNNMIPFSSSPERFHFPFEQVTYIESGKN